MVIARFEGDGLPEPEAKAEPGFAIFDPGVDPDDPEPVKRVLHPPMEKVTEEVPVHVDAIEATSPGAMPTTLVSPTASTPSNNTDVRAAEESTSRPFLTFVLVTLLAALGGAIFLASCSKPARFAFRTHPHDEADHHSRASSLARAKNSRFSLSPQSALTNGICTHVSKM